MWEPPARHPRLRAALAPAHKAERAMWEPPARHPRLRAALAPAHKAERAMWEPPARHHRLRAALAPAHKAERAMWEPPARHHRLRAALAPAHKAERAMWEPPARHHRRIEICRIGATSVTPGYFNSVDCAKDSPSGTSANLTSPRLVTSFGWYRQETLIESNAYCTAHLDRFCLGSADIEPDWFV